MSHTRRAATTLEGDLTNFEDGVAASLQVVKERLDTSDIADLQRISDKAERLSSTLQRDWEQQLKDGTFCGMVFVREVALATPLAWILREHLLKQSVEVATGTGSMQEAVRNIAFHRFRTGQSRLLVCNYKLCGGRRGRRRLCDRRTFQRLLNYEEPRARRR